MKDKSSFSLISNLIVFIWIVHFINILVGNSLTSLGLLPRTIPGLVGIFLSPFLHVSLSHLISNTFGLMFFGGLVSLQDRDKYTIEKLTSFSIFFGGLILWGIGRSSLHVGASLIVFSYFGFLLIRGWRLKRFIPMLISIGVIFLFGGTLLQVVPTTGQISWEGHLSGLIVGMIAGYSFKS